MRTLPKVRNQKMERIGMLKLATGQISKSKRNVILKRLYTKISNNVRIGCASGFWGDTTVAGSISRLKSDMNHRQFNYR